MKKNYLTIHFLFVSTMTLGISGVAQAEVESCGGTPYVKTASKNVAARAGVQIDLNRIPGVGNTWGDPLESARDKQNYVRLCNEKAGQEIAKIDKKYKEHEEKYNEAREKCFPYSQQGGATQHSSEGRRLCDEATALYDEGLKIKADRELKILDLKGECDAKQSAATAACDHLQQLARSEFGSSRRAARACHDRAARLSDPRNKFQAEFGPLCEVNSTNLRAPGLSPTGEVSVYGQQNLSGKAPQENEAGCMLPAEMIVTCSGTWDAAAICVDELPQCPPPLELTNGDEPEYIFTNTQGFLE